jgi:hypothetical protein
VNQSLTDGITEIDSDISAGEDIADATGGVSMLLQTFGVFRTMLGLIFLPYKYLISVGVPAYLALPIQIVCNVTFVWAVIQWVSGRSTKTFD